MRYASVFITETAKTEIRFAIVGDFPEGFAGWSKDKQYEWLDANAVNESWETQETNGIESVDAVYFDE